MDLPVFLFSTRRNSPLFDNLAIFKKRSNLYKDLIDIVDNFSPPFGIRASDTSPDRRCIGILLDGDWGKLIRHSERFCSICD